MAAHTGQLMKAGTHMAAPHPQQGSSYPRGQPHKWPADAPFIALEALGSHRGLTGPTNSPFGGNSQRSSTFLCALFFVLLKFSPSCRWSPPPPQPQKGAEAWGVIRNPDCAKLPCGRPSCNGAPHCLSGLDKESFLWSRCTPDSLDWSQGLQS